jgi:hypothetical protein
MSRNREELVNELQFNLWRVIENWVQGSDKIGAKVEELAELIIDELESTDHDPTDTPEEYPEEFCADMDQFEGVF